MSKLPDQPWSELSMDFYTFPNGAELLVVHDDFSRYPIVTPVKSTAFRNVENELNVILAAFGIPAVIRTDNGPPFNGKEWAAYSNKMGFRHRKVTYAWPEANGEVERLMRTLGKVMRTAVASGVNWQTQLQDFLRNYRATPHPATGVSPAELLFGRPLRTRLPDLQQHDAVYKERLKEAADRRRRVAEHQFAIGDRVWLCKEGKLLKKTEPFYWPDPFVVVAVHGSLVTARNREKEVTRNSSFFRKVVGDQIDLESDEDPVPDPALPDDDNHNPPPPAGRRRPPRVPALVRERPPDGPVHNGRRGESNPVSVGRRNPSRQAGLPVRLRNDYDLSRGRRGRRNQE